MITGITNVGLCLLLIPWLQFKGAAIAITLSDVTAVLVTCTLAFRNDDFKRCWPGFTRDAFRGWFPFLRLSIPSFMLLAVEAWTWTLQDFLAGFISAQALAVNAIAPTTVCLQYSIGGSLSCAATTVIGNLVGEGRANSARRAACLTLLLVPLCLTPTTLVLLALRHQLPYVFTQDEVIAQMIRHLLLITQIFAILDSHQAALTGILTGAGKQAVAAPLIIISYWLFGVPIGVVLAFGLFRARVFDLTGLTGLWVGMIVGVTFHAFSFGAVVWHLDWHKIVADVKQRQNDALGPVPSPLPMMRSVSGESGGLGGVMR